MQNALFEPGLSRPAEESTGTAYGTRFCDINGWTKDHLVPEMDNGMQESRPAVSDGALKQAY